jgi:hypothetical protein
MATVTWHCPVCPDDTPPSAARGLCTIHRVPLVARSEQPDRPAPAPPNVEPADDRPAAGQRPRIALRLAGGRVEVPEEGLVLGRSLPPLKGLPGMAALTQVSRYNQARLYWRADTLYVEDSGSTNGTYVDDVPAGRALPLVPGSRLRFGEDVPVEVLLLDELGMAVRNAGAS